MTYNNDKDKGKFNKEAFKHALSMVESSGGKFLDNSTSSAAGKYHFLWNLIKKDPSLKGITKRQFINNPKLQEKIMDNALDGKLEGYPGYVKYADKLKKEYGSELSTSDIAALTHFLGSGNIRKYLSNPSEFKVSGTNMSPEKYIEKFNGYFNEYKTPEHQTEPQPTRPDIRDPSLLEQPKDNTDIPGPTIKNLTEPDTHPSQHVYDENKRMGQVVNELNYGGYLGNNEGASGLVTLFENGGSHEQNPLGGIPQGVGANGKQNLVEEGETKWNDYIFSNEIKL